ncbi:cytoplasmic protein [Bacillus sp. T3]|uniref:cytoplasmic protein n=1 Tax=Bacillus sp. T3 TaxID=467262 RepID=UPI0029818C6B|nr:cytoplasmic protein [Bacillus sp. T3]
MNSEKHGDLIINGVGASNGGQFNQVLISGKGTINTAVDCTYFKCSGTGIVHSDIKSEKTKISGHAKISGNVVSHEFEIEGRALVRGNAEVHELDIKGRGFINGHVKAEEIKSQGSIVIGGDCEAESFKAEGHFKVGGLLTAEKIEIVLASGCMATEIGGSTIRVKQKSNIIRDLLKLVFPIKLEAELIEGDMIELENTKAKIVRGTHIIIGENCEIDRVEYKEAFRVEKNGLVHENIKL